MWLPSDHRLWSSFRYLEVARYRPHFEAVIREQVNHVPLILEVDEVEAWRERRGNLGLYTSVFRYDDKDVETAKRVANLYFDLDDKEGETEALGQARTLVAYFREVVSEDAIRIYFTGEKGFHVEVEAVALGVGVLGNISHIYRFIAAGLREMLDLTTVDFHVYDARRMWRLPNSQHQRSGFYKVPLTSEELELPLPVIWELALEPRDMKVPDQVFEVSANEWLHEWIVRRFAKEGTRVPTVQLPEVSSTEARKMMERQVKRVCESARGERNTVLNRAAFLLGRLVVSGTLESEDVEDVLLDAALGVGLEERESKRTIGSGMSAARRA